MHKPAFLSLFLLILSAYVLHAEPESPKNYDKALLAGNLGNLSAFYFMDEGVLAAYLNESHRLQLILLLEQALTVTDHNIKNSDKENYKRYYIVVGGIEKTAVKEDKSRRRVYKDGHFLIAPRVSKSEEIRNKAYLKQLIFRLKNNIALTPIASGGELLKKAQEQLGGMLPEEPAEEKISR
jgi:hypothetical protein